MIKTNKINFDEARFEEVEKQLIALNNTNMVSRSTVFFDSPIVKDFNLTNFYSIDCHTDYLKYGSEFGYVSHFYNLIETNYFKQRGYSQKQVKNMKDSPDYVLLVSAITYRLQQFYKSFLNEDYKVYCTLKKAKEYNLPINIIQSPSIDNIIGVDYILVINNKLVLYIHSISGSKTSYNYYNNKTTKTIYFKDSKGNKVFIDRKSLYRQSNHKVIVDYHKEYQSKKEMEDFYYRQIDNLFSDFYFLDLERAKKSAKEFREIVTYLNKLDKEEVVTNIAYNGK